MTGRRTMMVLASAVLAGSLLATGAQARGGLLASHLLRNRAAAARDSLRDRAGRKEADRFRAAAILLHLIDQHANTGIAPQLGTPKRSKLTPNESNGSSQT
jgi:hypothetical protein